MNHYAAVQLNTSTSYEEMKNSYSGSVSIISDRRVERERVFCPKPRRFPLANSTINDPIRPLRWYHSSHQIEPSESRIGIDLLDIILPKSGGGDADLTYSHLGSSPPYFCGSPPSRVSNPLIQDVRFGDEKFSSISPPSINPVSSGSSSLSPRKGGCMRSNFGNNPTVRVEGFDCLDRDGRNCSIPTLA